MNRLVFAVALLIAAVLNAQPLVDQVPGDAFVYVGWAGSQSLGPAYENSKFKKFMDSSALPQLLHETLPAILKQRADHKPDDAQRITMMQDLGKLLAKHPTAIYMRGLRVSDRTAKQTFPAMQVGIVCQAGEDKDALLKALGQIIHPAADKKAVAKVDSNGGVVTLIMGDAGDATGKLTDAAAFKTAREQFAADSALAVFVDVDAAVGRLDENMKADSPKSDYEAFTRGLDVSGIKGLRRIVMSAGFNKEEWQSRLFLDAPAPRKGLLKLLEPSPIDPALAGRIPPDAVSAAVMQFDFAALLATARELLTAIDPKTAREFNKGVGGLGMSIGRRIDTEILGPLGSQWAIFASPSTGGNGPMGLVAANKLGDAKVAKAAWTDLYNALANVLPKQLKQKGVTVTPAADNQAVAGTSLYSFKIDRVPVTPCFVINGDYIYFGVDPAVVAKAAAAEWPRRDGSAPYELQAAIMEVPRYTSFRYTDLAKTAPVILGSADTFWPMLVGPAADQGITLPKQLFPPADKIAGMLTPAGTYSWADDRGFHSRSRQPFPGAGMLGYLQGDETTLAVVGAGALGVSVPAMIKAREQANRVAAASSLRQISQGIHLHAAERDGMPPADLGALVTAKYFPTAKLFVSPASDTGVPPEIENGTPEQVAAWVKANSDFVYIKPPDKLAKVKNPSGVPIAYEKIGIHGIEGTNVGFVDGHVEWMSVPAATMLIRQTTGGDPVKYEPAK